MLLPLLAWERLAPNVLPALREHWLHATLNWATILRLRRCDVFICMSGIYLEAARVAKRRYGAQVWMHRGSRHILSQDEILSRIPGADQPSALTIHRELAGYALADRIVVQTRHVEQSFQRDPAAHAKLFRNPTGTDIELFSASTPRPAGRPLNLLFVGAWSLRKGCDVLAEAVRRTDGVRLSHVGSIADVEFPGDDARFHHSDAVPQWRLPEAYAAADLFVLASHEEGLSQVLIQALASGLPILCTDRSGGEDLAATPALAERITVTPAGNLGALTSALSQWRDRLWAAPLEPLLPADRAAISWPTYGARYNDELLASLAQRVGRPRNRFSDKVEAV
jgi:glycosyltransferase involved in cell wall biosynthesis